MYTVDMGTRTVASRPPSGEHMGQAFIDFAIENSADAAAPDAGRSRTEYFVEVVMDSGATHLCLPADAIERLGLALLMEVPVKVATGIEMRRVFMNALVTYEDRKTVTECIELPLGMPALLGAIPMEGMGIEPDLQNRRVRKLPLGLDGTYITA